MKKTCRRSVSLVIAFMMAISLIPFSGISASAAEPLVFNFTTRKTSWSGGQDIYGITYQYTDGNWQYHSAHPGAIGKRQRTVHRAR